MFSQFFIYRICEYRPWLVNTVRLNRQYRFRILFSICRHIVLCFWDSVGLWQFKPDLDCHKTELYVETDTEVSVSRVHLRDISSKPSHNVHCQQDYHRNLPWISSQKLLKARKRRQFLVSCIFFVKLQGNSVSIIFFFLLTIMKVNRNVVKILLHLF